MFFYGLVQFNFFIDFFVYGFLQCIFSTEKCEFSVQNKKKNQFPVLFTEFFQGAQSEDEYG